MKDQKKKNSPKGGHQYRVKTVTQKLFAEWDEGKE